MKRLYNAFFYSLHGLYYGFVHEPAIRQEIILLILGILVNILLPISRIWHITLILSLIVLLMVELLNTGLEKTCDCISTSYNPLIKVVKDMGSAAVLLALISVGILWIYAIVVFVL